MMLEMVLCLIAPVSKFFFKINLASDTNERFASIHPLPEHKEAAV